jgi:transcriptional regulator with XRE-family HTH domain
MDKASLDERVKHVTASLEALVLLSDRTRRSLEQELGLGSAGISKILNGTVRLQVRHVFLLSEALGVDPGQFFHWAVPPQGSPSPLLARARGSQPAEESAAEGERFDLRVRQALARLLGLEAC